MDILSRDYEEYTGAAIYALIGSDNKRYIGKAINYSQRMKQHLYALNAIAKGKEAPEGFKMREAVKCGTTFKAEILEKIPPAKNTHNYLCEREDYYFRYYGGMGETYNSTYPTPPNYFYAPYNECR